MEKIKKIEKLFEFNYAPLQKLLIDVKHFEELGYNDFSIVSEYNSDNEYVTYLNGSRFETDEEYEERTLKDKSKKQKSIIIREKSIKEKMELIINLKKELEKEIEDLNFIKELNNLE